jgi:DNA-binding transcriptional ArsR family regulator
MPFRQVVSKELATFLGVLGHPHRVRIVEELRGRELDVNSLQTLLGVSHSGVSQHLSILRSHRVVKERREGRHVYYQLSQPGLAGWLRDGLQFLEAGLSETEQMQKALEETRTVWSEEEEPAQ